MRRCEGVISRGVVGTFYYLKSGSIPGAEEEEFFQLTRGEEELGGEAISANNIEGEFSLTKA